MSILSYFSDSIVLFSRHIEMEVVQLILEHNSRDTHSLLTSTIPTALRSSKVSRDFSELDFDQIVLVPEFELLYLETVFSNWQQTPRVMIRGK
jgi:hypothetical protein